MAMGAASASLRPPSNKQGFFDVSSLGVNNLGWAKSKYQSGPNQVDKHSRDSSTRILAPDPEGVVSTGPRFKAGSPGAAPSFRLRCDHPWQFRRQAQALIGSLARVYSVPSKELMIAAAFEGDSFRPGMVSVVQTFGEAARFPPARACACFSRRLEYFWRVDPGALHQHPKGGGVISSSRVSLTQGQGTTERAAYPAALLLEEKWF